MAEVDTDLPKTLVKRLVKNKLAGLVDSSDGAKREVQINKDALLAFSESAKVFINYLTTTANDICHEHKRQTISADDVLQALDDLDFVEMVPQLKDALEAFRKTTKDKNQKKAEQNKKRKAQADQGPGQATGAEDDAGDADTAADVDAEDEHGGCT
eukprot:jgi/Chrzof1/1442/Cz10g08040.t1